MSKFLALGIGYDEPSSEIYTFSRAVHSKKPQIVANFLLEEGGKGYPFKQILLFHRDTLVKHWNLNRDYVY